MTRFKLVPAQILAVLAFTSTGFAQQRPAFEYAVKFVCGSPPDVAAPPVAPGRYFTAINVHNPGDRPIGFRKKFAIALPGERVGPISKFFDARLGPDEAFEIDCADILQAFGPRQQQRLMKGFAVIQLFDTTAALDVVAVYTAAGSTRQVETMDVERVPARRVAVGPPPGLPDLVPVADSCVRDSLGLRVTIRNLGTAPSGPCTEARASAARQDSSSSACARSVRSAATLEASPSSPSVLSAAAVSRCAAREWAAKMGWSAGSGSSPATWR